MQWNGLKVTVIVLSLLAGLGILLGGQWLYNRYNYERPLSRLLGENGDVISYSINDRGRVPEIDVRLRKVDNLKESYDLIAGQVKEISGGKEFSIKIQDDRDQTLEGIYYYAGLAAYEAMSRGNYIEMEGYVARRAADEGAQARLYVDRDRVYIEITRGDKYLYEVIPRTDRQGTAITGTEGGRPS
ncbi:MAG: hypothetical protein ACOY31_03860 [Bacillota bacterium]